MKPTEIARLLPAVFQQVAAPGTPVYALLEVMSALQGPSEIVLEDLDRYFDPRRTTDRFVPYLAGWLDLDRLFDESFDDAVPESAWPSGLDRLRSLVAVAAALSAWRGTERGLRLFLAVATGTTADAFAIERPSTARDGAPKPFHIAVIAPEALHVHQRLIERIVESEKPAFVTWELAFRAPATKVS